MLLISYVLGGVYMYIQVPTEVSSLGAGAAGCCKLPDVGAETETQSLCSAACTLFTPHPASRLLIMRLLDLVQGSSLREKDGEEVARLTRMRTWLCSSEPVYRS